MEKKNAEEITGEFFECPYCICLFATKSDLNAHLQAYGDYKEGHVRKLDEAHRKIDYSFRGQTMSKDAKKKR